MCIITIHIICCLLWSWSDKCGMVIKTMIRWWSYDDYLNYYWVWLGYACAYIFVNYSSSTKMLKCTGIAKLRLKRHQVGKLSLCSIPAANYVDKAGLFLESCKNFSQYQHYQQKSWGEQRKCGSTIIWQFKRWHFMMPYQRWALIPFPSMHQTSAASLLWISTD